MGGIVAKLKTGKVVLEMSFDEAYALYEYLNNSTYIEKPTPEHDESFSNVYSAFFMLFGAK